MATIIVKPVAGVCVRDPETRQLVPADGLRVERNTFWSRRIKEGAVVVVQETQPFKGQATPKSAKGGE